MFTGWGTKAMIGTVMISGRDISIRIALLGCGTRSLLEYPQC
jgi:hypothetical protein